MKRNVIVKLFIDITMTVLYALLMFAKNLGGFFHEIVGLGIGILFVIHVLLNLSMIKGLFKSVKEGKITKKILLFSDIALTVCMPIVIITGILIAKELFVIWTDFSWEILFNTHNILSYVCLGIMALHILLHAKYLLGVFKKLPSSFKGKEMKSAALRYFVGAAAAVFIYSSLAVFKNIFDDQELLMISVSSNVTNTVPSNVTNIAPAAPSNSENFAAAVPASSSVEHTEPILPSINKDDKASVTENTSSDHVITSEENTTPQPPTLEEYLSGLRCTGCSKRCFLLNPRCSKGQAQAAKAKTEYNRIYNV